jgi:hypothetical protein
MDKLVKLTDIKDGVVYYTDTVKDCEVILNKIVNKTIYFDIVSESNGKYAYIPEPDGTIAFPLQEDLLFIEKNTDTV